MKSTRLASMPLAALRALRDKIDKTIGKRIVREEKLLRQKIAELSAFDDDRPRRDRPPEVDSGRRNQRRGKAPIKYRGPKGETWSGRGTTPLWLKALLRGGKKKEDFLIGAPAKRATKRAVKKTAKRARKKATKKVAKKNGRANQKGRKVAAQREQARSMPNRGSR